MADRSRRAPRRGGRSVRTILGVIASATLTLALVTTGAPARAVTPSPTLTIAPAGPYLDRQTVHVIGTGLRPGAVLSVAECAGYCSWRNGPIGTVPADGTLAFDVELMRYVEEYDPTPYDPPLDCARRVCSLALIESDHSEEDGYGVRAATVLPFADVPPVLPDVHVTPTHDLPTIAALDVRASGFTPAEPVAVYFCTRTPGACGADVAGPTADADGRIATTVTVYRIGAFWDCVETPMCSLVFRGFRPGDNVTVPLTFDPDAPVNRPTVSLDRDHDLALRDTVQAHASRLPPSTDIRVEQCEGSAAGQSSGRCLSSVVTRTDASGNLSAMLPVRRYIDQNIYDEPTDCADADACFVTVSGASMLPPTRAPITFARHTADAAVTIGSTDVVEGTGDAFTIAKIPVTMDHPTSTSVWVDWYAGAPFESARTNDDYSYATGTLWIPAGTTRAVITVPIIADTIDEATESFTVLGSRVDGARFADNGSHATVAILDDDRRPQVDIGAALVREHAGQASVPVRLSAVSERDVTVTYVTHHASARSGEDFVRTRGSVIVPAYWLGTRIHIPIVDDRRAEPGERFWIELTGAHNGVLRTDHADVWIGDDD